MEKYVSHLDPTPSVSSASPLFNQESQPSVTKNHLNGDNENDRECVSCHLCAIEVPRRFINEHYKSDKHKINTKIADVALERVRKLLHYNIVRDVDKTESLYFCPQCLITLHPKDRQGHEKTVVHKNSLTVDKFLYDFYVLYANDDRSMDISRECEATVAVQTNDVVNETDLRECETTVVQASVESVDESDIPVNIVKNQLSISEMPVQTNDVVNETDSRECETTVEQAIVESVDETDIPVNIVKNQLSISEMPVQTNDVVNETDSRECETTVVHAIVESVDETDIPVNIVKNQLSISENIEIETDDVENTNNIVINSGSLKTNTINNNYKGIKVENTPNISTSEVDNSQFCTFGEDKNKIFCISCKVYVPNNTKNLLSHQKGLRHKEIMRKLKNILI